MVNSSRVQFLLSRTQMKGGLLRKCCWIANAAKPGKLSMVNAHPISAISLNCRHVQFYTIPATLTGEATQDRPALDGILSMRGDTGMEECQRLIIMYARALTGRIQPNETTNVSGRAIMLKLWCAGRVICIF